MRGAAWIADQVDDAQINPRGGRQHVGICGKLRRVDDHLAAGHVRDGRVDITERGAVLCARPASCRIELRSEAGGEDRREVANAAGTLQQRDHPPARLGAVEVTRLCKHAAPDRTLAYRHTAAAEPALGETALPQVAHFAGRETPVALAEQTGKERTSAPASPGDV